MKYLLLQQLQYEFLFNYHITSKIAKHFFSTFGKTSFTTVDSKCLHCWLMTVLLERDMGHPMPRWGDQAVTSCDLPSRGFDPSSLLSGYFSCCFYSFNKHGVWFPHDTMLTMQNKTAEDVNNLRNQVITCNLSSWNPKVCAVLWMPVRPHETPLTDGKPLSQNHLTHKHAHKLINTNTYVQACTAYWGPSPPDLPLTAFERGTYDHWCCLFLPSQNADEQEVCMKVFMWVYVFEDADCQPV